MTLSSLLGVSPGASPELTAELYAETKLWLRERVGVSGGVVDKHTSQLAELLTCFLELCLSDNAALVFCRAHIEKSVFWLEWEIYGESGTPDSQHQERCAFLSKLVAGRPTVMMNIPAH